MLPARRERGYVAEPRSGWASRVGAELATATVGAGALGVGVAIADQSSLAGTAAGVAGWVFACLMVGFAAWRRWVRTPLPDTIDPWALPEPWRSLVGSAVDAGRRFHGAVEAWPPGPLRDRLDSMARTVDTQMRSFWDTARQGAAVTGGYPTGTRATPLQDLSLRLAAIHDERSSLPEGRAGRAEELDRAEEAVAAQLRAAKRSASAAAASEDALHAILAKLEDAVSAVAELGPASRGIADVDGIGTSIESLAGELSALSAGLKQVSGAVPGALPPAGDKPYH